jgi:hypothetical protein
MLTFCDRFIIGILDAINPRKEEEYMDRWVDEMLWVDWLGGGWWLVIV